MEKITEKTMSLDIKVMPLGPISVNCYILTDKKSRESAVIDPGDFNEALKNAVKDLNIKYILLTHGHFDHILGVCGLKEFTGAKVLIHKLDGDCLSDEKKSLCSWECPGKQKKMSADILLSDNDKISIGDAVLRVMHTPGHTKGGVCYIDEKDKLIFSGDTLFCLSAGRSDFPGGSTKELFESLKRLRDLPGDYTVCPGHNKATTLDFERKNNRYMRAL